MARKILILGASYGSLLGTKLLMAGQDVTLVCRAETADLINRNGHSLPRWAALSASSSSFHHSCLAASWILLEFTDWAVDQYALSPNLTNFVVTALLLLLPAVAVLAWRHGTPGEDLLEY